MKRSMIRRTAPGGEVEDDLRVRCRLGDGAVPDEIAADRERIGQIAVMRHREPASGEFREERLHVAQDGAAGRRVAHVADRGAAPEPLDRRAVGEGIADEAGPALGMENLAVEGDDARCLLAAVLKRVETERHDRRGVRVPEDPEDAALLAQRIPIAVEPIGEAGMGLNGRGAL